MIKNSFYRRTILATAGIILSLSSTVWAQALMGVVESMEGGVKIERGTDIAPLLEGSAIYEKDTIKTENGYVIIKTEDGGIISMRPWSVFQVEAFQAKGNADDKSFFKLLKGSVRILTGFIGKYATNNYRISTANATVGIRGTDHETTYIPETGWEGDKNALTGTYERVHQGESTIRFGDATNPVQSVKVGQGAFLSFKDKRPKLLTRQQWPKFFFNQPKHEAQFGERYKKVMEHRENVRNQRLGVRQNVAKTQQIPGPRNAGLKNREGAVREKLQQQREQSKAAPKHENNLNTLTDNAKAREALRKKQPEEERKKTSRRGGEIKRLGLHQ